MDDLLDTWEWRAPHLMGLPDDRLNDALRNAAATALHDIEVESPAGWVSVALQVFKRPGRPRGAAAYHRDLLAPYLQWRADLIRDGWIGLEDLALTPHRLALYEHGDLLYAVRLIDVCEQVSRLLGEPLPGGAAQA